MRKLISTTMMGVLFTGFGIGISGCSDETSTKKEVITTSPTGKTVESQESKIKQTGDNPPAPTKAP